MFFICAGGDGVDQFHPAARIALVGRQRADEASYGVAALAVGAGQGDRERGHQGQFRQGVELQQVAADGAGAERHRQVVDGGAGNGAQRLEARQLIELRRQPALRRDRGVEHGARRMQGGHQAALRVVLLHAHLAQGARQFRTAAQLAASQFQAAAQQVDAGLVGVHFQPQLGR
jgi:hypothetical protein